MLADMKWHMMFGALLGVLPFAGALFTSARLAPLAAIPLPLALCIAAFVSIYQARRYKDITGITWYGKYGSTPGAYFLWGFMYIGCIAIAGMATAIHFPFWGSHYVGKSGPTYTFITEGSCVDGSNSKLCTLELCNATIAGDVEFESSFCSRHPETCKGRRTSYDWALRNCLHTCGCTGIFDPVYQTAEGSTFECERTETCYQKRNFNVMWNYVAHPRWIEVHVVTGVPIMLFAPLQFLKQIRQWSNFKFHRWNGRILLLLVIPNQISALVLAIIGLTDKERGSHTYTKVFRIGLGLMSFFTLFYGACAFYFIRQKNVKRHGEFMMRLMSCWYGIPFFRMVLPFCESFVSVRWSFGLSGWCWVFLFIATEIYIQKSERFVQPSNEESKSVDAKPIDVKPVGAVQTQAMGA